MVVCETVQELQNATELVLSEDRTCLFCQTSHQRRPVVIMKRTELVEDNDLLCSHKQPPKKQKTHYFTLPYNVDILLFYTHVCKWERQKEDYDYIVHSVPVLQIFLVQVNLLGSIRVFAWLKIYTTYWRNAYDVVIWYSNTSLFPHKTGRSYCESGLYTS